MVFSEVAILSHPVSKHMQASTAWFVTWTPSLHGRLVNHTYIIITFLATMLLGFICRLMIQIGTVIYYIVKIAIP